MENNIAYRHSNIWQIYFKCTVKLSSMLEKLHRGQEVRWNSEGGMGRLLMWVTLVCGCITEPDKKDDALDKQRELDLRSSKRLRAMKGYFFRNW